MISFFEAPNVGIYAVESSQDISRNNIQKLVWLFSDATHLDSSLLSGTFIGPRKEMITPWSTNAVEITQNMGIRWIQRIEMFISTTGEGHQYDPMLQRIYHQLGQELFQVNKEPEPILALSDIEAYNESEGLALSEQEIEYLKSVATELGRDLTDSEIFGYSQVNSEHCRHKIFNGEFIIDGKTKSSSLFQLIKKTSRENPNRLVSAYKDNVAFVEGPIIEQFAPKTQDKPDFFETKSIDSVISLKAETHNFPTTVEPFNGAATGSGGEIRDRMAGGKGSLPLAGTAVYMTSYPRPVDGRVWEEKSKPRNWLYQSPLEILIKASNGASDFGNKFGQPLISGSLLTFQHEGDDETLGYDKVIMLAGGIGFGKKQDSLKSTPNNADPIVLLGGDNYRIGMGGGAVSSVDTGQFSNAIELSAIQRSNPEMQKRVANVIRAMAEHDNNPIVSVHDHGAGGHLNCLSELVEETGGIVDVGKLPVGDPTLSEKEIIGNESQERMGLIIPKKALEELKAISARERAPVYVIGETTGDHRFTFKGKGNKNPIDWSLSNMFGSSPGTILEDKTIVPGFLSVDYDPKRLEEYVVQVLQLESVACKDWLTNKVDRSVTGKVAKQQTCGELQLPLNNVGVMALDFSSNKGVATAIGHAPIAGLISSSSGAVLSIMEALTNLVWAPVEGGLSGVSLSANWMWPCKNPGEDTRLYEAVEAVSTFSCDLGINIPTGKDSLSMTQKYPDGSIVKAPGTVIISSVGEVCDIRKIVEPVMQPVTGSSLIYIYLSDESFELGGSSFSQSQGSIGDKAPNVADAGYVANVFNTIQEAILEEEILAGHDVSAGGLITCLLEMTFPSNNVAFKGDISSLHDNPVRACFSEQPALVVQAEDDRLQGRLKSNAINYQILGEVTIGVNASLTHSMNTYHFGINEHRNTWFESSYLMDKIQSGNEHATLRKNNLGHQPLTYSFPKDFSGKLSSYGLTTIQRPSLAKAAIIREKGVNGDREMAYALYLAGFEVKDVHMTDLTSGRENLEDISMIVFVGGFSNSDVLGSAKGWAGAFLYNEKAKHTLDKFYARPDTLSLGVCNGCQLMMELNLLYPNLDHPPKMAHNSSRKFESGFVGMKIPENYSILLSQLEGTNLGIWVAHGEGRFILDESDNISIAGKFSYEDYPANPNGSDLGVAAICSDDGRHLAMMPHLERSIFPWNWPYYPSSRKDDEVSPWIMAFVDARKWIESNDKWGMLSDD